MFPPLSGPRPSTAKPPFTHRSRRSGAGGRDVLGLCGAGQAVDQASVDRPSRVVLVLLALVALAVLGHPGALPALLVAVILPGPPVDRPARGLDGGRPPGRGRSRFARLGDGDGFDGVAAFEWAARRRAGRRV